MDKWSLVAVQGVLLFLTGSLAIAAMQRQGPENFPRLGVIFLEPPALIGQIACMVAIFGRTSGNIEDGDGSVRAISVAIPGFGFLLAMAALL